MDADETRRFEHFVAVAGPRLLATATALCGGDTGAGEDLLQAALVKLARHWNRAETPEAYVRTSLVRLATDRWRRTRVRVTEVSPERFDASDPRQDSAFAAVDLRAALLPALRSLPAKQRAVLTLRYLEDLNEAETAAAMGVPVGSVKSLHSRALAKLRETVPSALSSEVR